MVSHCARPTLTFSQFISQPSTGVRSFRLRPSSEALLRARAPGAKKAPHTRTPHLLRPRVARAQETIRLHPLLCSEPLLKGAVEVALNCAHRATTVLSWGLCEHEGHLAALPHPSKLARFLSTRAAWLILECARRTRPFRGRAFREQEDHQAAPSPLS